MMTNNSFIQELSAAAGYTADDTQRLVDAMAGIFTENFQQGNEINVADFGFFEVEKHLEKIVLDAKTDKKTLFPPKLELKFKPAKSLTTVKEKVLTVS